MQLESYEICDKKEGSVCLHWNYQLAQNRYHMWKDKYLTLRILLYIEGDW